VAREVRNVISGMNCNAMVAAVQHFGEFHRIWLVSVNQVLINGTDRRIHTSIKGSITEDGDFRSDRHEMNVPCALNDRSCD
jgi:hypothetical protein